MRLTNFYNLMKYIDFKFNLTVRKNSFRIIMRIIRVIMPIYYLISIKSSGISKDKVDKEPKVIVSLTTIPDRMDNIWMVLESLLRQTKKPNKIILWLASSQFPQNEDVDIKVLKMKKRGLEIRYCENLKSHKKYYYTMKEYKDDIVITVDDDVFYPENLIEKLMERHYEFPDAIVCNRGHQITFEDEKVATYDKWNYLSSNVLGPNMLLMPTGVGGVLYPPNCLSKEVFNKKSIQNLCLQADDIWLRCMGYMKGTPVVKVINSPSRLFTTNNSNKTGLAQYNVKKGGNDAQFKNVVKHYNINFEKQNK